MIIRKPYAILIKNFKLIHALLFAMMSYLLYRSYSISHFFSEYFADDRGVVGQELTDSLFSNWMYFFTIVIILGLIIVLVLMVFKKKPVKYYIGSILAYVIFLIVLNIDNSTISTMEIEQLSARTVRAMADITLIMMAVQAFVLVLTFVRATGFNIKQFDFEKDLQELNITEEDREEVEVGLNVDAGKFERRLRKNLRHAKYVYLENKLICNILIVVAILLLGYGIYTNSGLNDKFYKQGQSFQTGSFVINIEESYITDKNYTGKKFENNKTILVLKMKIRNIYNTPVKLEMARAELTIKGHKYYPNTNYYSDMIDFGNIYQSEKIGSTDTNYVFCYEIPSNYVEEKMIFQYVQNISGIKNKLEVTYQKVRIEPIDLRTNLKVKEYKIGEKIDMTGTIFGSTKFAINSYTVQKEFKFTYNFCPVTNECYQSNEYIKPNVLTNYNKVLLRMNVALELNHNYINSSYKDIFQFVSKFGTIEYKVDGKWKSHTLGLVQVKPTKVATGSDLYIEVLEEVATAENIRLVLSAQNQKYHYILK